MNIPHNLFSCPQIRTTLSALDLWRDPSGIAALLDSWQQTPIMQKKRTPPNKQGGVGRQQGTYTLRLCVSWQQARTSTDCKIFGYHYLTRHALEHTRGQHSHDSEERKPGFGLSAKKPPDQIRRPEDYSLQRYCETPSGILQLSQLADHRNQRLTMMYKIHNNLVGIHRGNFLEEKRRILPSHTRVSSVEVTSHSPSVQITSTTSRQALL